VVNLDDQGHMKTLRPGTNGWTRLTHHGRALHGDGIEHHPVSSGKYGLEWIETFVARRLPDPDHIPAG
jgi:hypothetical protein